jgi:hypothetical protein
MYMSLPLPESRVRSCSITMIHVDGSKMPTRYTVEVPSTGSVKDILYALAQVRCWLLPQSIHRRHNTKYSSL